MLLKFASEGKEVCSFTHYQKSPKLCKLAVNDCQTHSAKFLKIILEPGIKSYVCFSFGTAGSLCGVISCNPAAIVRLNNVFPSFLGFLGISFLTNQTRPGQVFWFAISIAINNAYILYKMSEAYHVTRYSRAQFGERLVKELLGLEDTSPSH